MPLTFLSWPISRQFYPILWIYLHICVTQWSISLLGLSNKLVASLWQFQGRHGRDSSTLHSLVSFQPLRESQRMLVLHSFGLIAGSQSILRYPKNKSPFNAHARWRKEISWFYFLTEMLKMSLTSKVILFITLRGCNISLIIPKWIPKSIWEQNSFQHY